jgi:hypothetical protein
MSEKHVLLLLRAVIAREIETAPRQHRLWTPECPPLPRFAADELVWSQEEQAHITGCAYCRKVLGFRDRLREDEDRGKGTTMNDAEFMRLLSAAHRAGVKKIGERLVRDRKDCLKITRAWLIALDPDMLTPEETAQIARCIHCAKLVEQMQAHLTRPSLRCQTGIRPPANLY